MSDTVKGITSLIALIFVGWIAFSACQSDAADSHVAVTSAIASWTPLDDHNVIAVVTQTNTGTVAGSALCTYEAEAPGGGAGDATDGAAHIAPGQTVRFEVRIHTDVAADEITDVTVDNSICAISADSGS